MATEDSAPRGAHSLAALPAPILPDPSRIFLERARRFTVLAKEHSLADWLSFLGRLTLIQHQFLQHFQPNLPDETELASFRDRGLPPISAISWQRDPAWRDALATIARDMAPHAPPAGRRILERLRMMGASAIEALADRVMRIELGGEDAEFLPFISAALQVYWTSLAARLDPKANLLPGTGNFCPSCGYSAVAAIVRTDREVSGLRYLHCALCNTQWHLVRATCAACGDASHIAYLHLDAGKGAVRAETCDACRSYLKIVYREKSSEADPVADDLATLALDLLVDGAGYERVNPNLLFVPGS